MAVQKGKKQYDDDPGITIAPMDVEGMPGYEEKKLRAEKARINGMNISKSERRAMIKGAYLAMLPMLLVAVGMFCASFGLVVLWMLFIR